MNHFLKIDTEGYDLPVLKGFPWHNMKPTVVLCEFEDRKTVPLGYNFHDMAGYLRGRGYELLISEWYPVVEYGRQHRWRRFGKYPCELVDANGWGNILAFRDGIDWVKLINAVAAGSVRSTKYDDAGQVREQLEYMRDSWSWRITEPLRFAMKSLKSLKALKGEVSDDT